MNNRAESPIAITSNLAERLAYHIHEKSNLPAPEGEEVRALLEFLRKDSERIGPKLRNGPWIEQVRLDAAEMFSRTRGGTLLTCWATKARDRIDREAALATVPQKVKKDRDGNPILTGHKRWRYEQIAQDICKLQSAIPFLQGQIHDTKGRIQHTEIHQTEADFANFDFTRVEYLANERDSLARFETELTETRETLRLRQMAMDNFDAGATGAASDAAATHPAPISDAGNADRPATAP